MGHSSELAVRHLGFLKLSIFTADVLKNSVILSNFMEIGHTVADIRNISQFFAFFE